MNLIDSAILVVLVILTTIAFNPFFKVDSRQILQESLIDGTLAFDTSLYTGEEPLAYFEWLDLYFCIVMAGIFFFGIIPTSFRIAFSLVNLLAKVFQQYAEAALVWSVNKIEILSGVLNNGAENCSKDFQLTPVESKIIYVAKNFVFYVDMALSFCLDDENKTIEDISPKQTKTEVEIAKILKEWEIEDRRGADGKKWQKYGAAGKIDIILDNISEVSKTSRQAKTVSDGRVDGGKHMSLRKNPESLGVSSDGILPQDTQIEGSGSRDPDAIMVKNHTFTVSPLGKLRGPPITIGREETALDGLEGKAKGQAYTQRKSRVAPKADQPFFVYPDLPQLIVSSTMTNWHEELKRSGDIVSAGSTSQHTEPKLQAPQSYISTLPFVSLELPDSQAGYGDDTDMDLEAALSIEPKKGSNNLPQAEIVEIEMAYSDGRVGEYMIEEGHKDEEMSMDDIEIDMDFLFRQAEIALQIPSAVVALPQTPETMEQHFTVSPASREAYSPWKETQSSISRGEHTAVATSCDFNNSLGNIRVAPPQAASILQEVPKQPRIVTFGIHSSLNEPQVIPPQATPIPQFSTKRSAVVVSASGDIYNPTIDTLCSHVRVGITPGFVKPTINTNTELTFAAKVSEIPRNKRKLEATPNTTEGELLQPRMAKPLHPNLKETNGALSLGNTVRQKPQKPTVVIDVGEEAKRVKKDNYVAKEAKEQANYDSARINTQKMLNETPSKGDLWLKERLDAKAVERGEIIGSDGFFQLGTRKRPTRRR